MVNSAQAAPIIQYNDPRLYGNSLGLPFRLSYECTRCTVQPWDPSLYRIADCAIRALYLVIGILGMAITSPFSLVGRSIQIIHYHLLSTNYRNQPDLFTPSNYTEALKNKYTLEGGDARVQRLPDDVTIPEELIYFPVSSSSVYAFHAYDYCTSETVRFYYNPLRLYTHINQGDPEKAIKVSLNLKREQIALVDSELMDYFKTSRTNAFFGSRGAGYICRASSEDGMGPMAQLAWLFWTNGYRAIVSENQIGLSEEGLRTVSFLYILDPSDFSINSFPKPR